MNRTFWAKEELFEKLDTFNKKDKLNWWQIAGIVSMIFLLAFVAGL